jgi:FHS family glucose/mannose:H+ symporter-like MFS transporter
MKRFLLTLHGIFILVGIANTILGPLLPLLAQRWNLSDRASGVLFFVQFLGGFTGAIVSTRFARRMSLQALTRTGLLLIAAGYAALASGQQNLALVSMAASGLGLGFTNPAITVMVGDVMPERRAAILNLLNFAWALGAITAPILVVAALRNARFAVGGMLAGFAVMIGASALFVPRANISQLSAEAPRTRIPAATVRLIAACALLVFIYVGIENGVSGWLPTFATRVRSFTYARSALLQDTFWTMFLLGRLSAPAFLSFMSERLLLTLSICFAAVGTLMLLLAQAAPLIFVAVAIIGLGCAAIFPTAIAILSERLSGPESSQLGFVFASAGLGAAVLPFLIGSLSSTAHSLLKGMWLLCAAEAFLLAAHGLMSWLSARAVTSSTAVA